MLHVYRIVSWLRISLALPVVEKEQLLMDLTDVFNYVNLALCITNSKFY